ncbi:hypothetical protein ACJ41O_000524 [Fusarium nematophilum]
MPDVEEVAEVPPTFVSSISAGCPPLYFFHVVDPEAATLTVQVLGTNLTLKFTHGRAKQIPLKSSSISSQLDNKTVGFVALVSRSTERIVLAAAESGHGSGRFGDLLDPEPGVLANSVWTKRVIAVGKLLGFNMRRPFDGMGRAPLALHEGIFLGSHVEVKLAVHGICVLLETFGITRDFDSVTLEQLNELRDARWDDGSRPVFEVYFSRKHCHPCRSLVQKLAEATGVTIRLLWKHRLIMKTYAVTCKRVGGNGRSQDDRPEEEEEQPVFDTQDFDFGDVLPDDSDVETIPDDDDDDEPKETIDLTRSASPDDALAGDYIDGFAYRVGQLESSPDGATAAIVEFARAVQRHSSNQSRQSVENINKPLPATPVFMAPAEMATESSSSERHTFPRVRRTLFSRDRPSARDEQHARARSASPSAGRTVRERSPRPFNIDVEGRTVTNRSRGRICVEIPARSRASA